MGSCLARDDGEESNGTTCHSPAGVSLSVASVRQADVELPKLSTGASKRSSGIVNWVAVLIALSFACGGGGLPHCVHFVALTLIVAGGVWCTTSRSSASHSSPEVVEYHCGMRDSAEDCSKRGTDAALPCFRVQDEEAAKMRARGEDPYVGQRLNYLQGTAIPFEPLLSQLTAKQKERYDKFECEFPSALAADARLDRQRFYQMPDRFMMLLFLQADQYNVDLGVKRLVDTVVWRQQFGVDDWIDNPDWKVFSCYLKYRTKRILGFDKSGRVFLAERLGEFFGSDNGERALPRETWTMCHAFELSLIGAAFRVVSIRENRAIHRLNYVGDMAGLRVRQASKLLDFLKYITQGVERYFPETAGKVILFNAPGFLSSLISIAKFFLNKETVANLQVHSGDAKQAKLRDHVGPQVLPREWGGELDYIVPHIPPLPALSPHPTTATKSKFNKQ